MMPCHIFENVTVIKRRVLIYIIDCFTAETSHGKSLWEKRNVLYLVHFFPIDHISKITICYIAASEHPDVIEGRRRLISTDGLDSEYSAEDCSIDNYGGASDH